MVYSVVGIVCVFSAVCIKIVSAENIQIFTQDHQNRIVIQNDIGTLGNSNLFFGKTLSQALYWDNSENNFVFTNDVNFSGHQIKNVKLENNTLANKICNSAHSGEIYYNIDDVKSYVCSGVVWRKLDNDIPNLGGLKPYLHALNKTTIGYNETTDILVTGGNFTSSTIFTLNSGAVLNYTVINSDNSVTLNVTGGNSNASVAVIAENFFGNNLSFTVN